MSLRDIEASSTDQSTVVRVVDSVDGTPETGVAFDTTGVDLWYRREGAAKVSITEVTLASASASHADGGFIHIGDGYCRLDLPDAAVAAGAAGVLVGGKFDNMVVIGSYHRLVSPGADGVAQVLLLVDGTAFVLLPAGRSVYFRIFDNAGLAWDFTAQAFVAIGSTSNDYIAATERTAVGGSGRSGYTASLPISALHTGGTPKGLTLLAFIGGSPADTDPTALPPLAFEVQFGRLGAGQLNVPMDISVKSTEGNAAQLKVWLDRDNERMPVSTAGGAVFTANAGTDVITSNDHGLSGSDVVLLTTSNTLPGGLSAETPYFVRDVTTHTFKLAATSGGAAIDITSTGTGVHKWHAPAARLRLREHGADDATFLFDQEFTAEHLVDNCFEVELNNPNFTTDRQYDVLAEVTENGATHATYHPSIVM